jgi:hypothetical protein
MKTLVTTGSLCLLLYSCGPAAEEKAKVEAMRLQNQEQAEIRTSDSLAVATIELNPNNPLHQNVARKARFKMEVKNCKQSNLLIEKWVSAYSGLITSSKLSNDVMETRITPIDNDSCLEMKRIKISQHIQLKLPQVYLSALLSQLDSLADLVEERELSAENLSIDILDKKLTISRLSNVDSKLIKPKTEVQSLLAQDAQIDRKAQSDEALLGGMKLQSQVNYSVVQIEMYEQEKVLKRLILNKISFSNDPNLLSKIWISIVDGWKILEFFFLFIIRIWSLLLIGLIAYLLFKRYLIKQ